MKKVSIMALHLGYGGIEKCVCALSNMLIEDYEVEILCSYKLLEEPVFELDPRVKIKYLITKFKPNRDEWKRSVKKLNLFSFFKETYNSIMTLILRKKTMIEAIKNCDADIIISTRVLFNNILSKYGKEGVYKIGWEHNHYHDDEGYAKKVVDTFVRKPFIDVNYNMKHDYLGLMVSGDIPFSTFTENKFSINKMGFGLEMLYLQNTAFVLGVDYIHNMEAGNNLHAGLFGLDFTRRLFNNLAWYIGGGAGLRFDVANEACVPRKNSYLVDTGYFAWKADTGFIINISHIFTKIEVSYNNVIGFSVGAGLGFGVEM